MQALIGNLSGEIDDLESALAPLLTTPITSLTTTLPILDKSKLYVLSTYAIESLLFSYIRLSGADARSHPVFTELARVKQYFDKIKNAENPQTAKPRDLRLDKGAAKRFITAALAGNKSYDEEREGRKDLEKEAAGLKRKADDAENEEGRTGAAESPIPSKKTKKEKSESSLVYNMFQQLMSTRRTQIQQGS